MREILNEVAPLKLKEGFLVKSLTVDKLVTKNDLYQCQSKINQLCKLKDTVAK